MADRPAERTAATRPTRTVGRDDTAVRPAAAPQRSARPPRPPAPTPPRQAPVAQSTRADRPRRSRAAAPAQATPGVRRARLRLTRVDPWSVMKTAFLLSIAFGIVTIVSVFMVWSVLSAAGVWDSINSTVQEIVGGQDAANFDVEDYLGTSRVLGFTMLVAVVDVILLTAMATLGAFLYNMAAQLLGGVEVTLSEDA
jgi:hypothetical protein